MFSFDGNKEFSYTLKNGKIGTTKDANDKDADSKKCVENVNTGSVLKFRHMDQDEKERHIREWQAVAKILDKLLLFINLLFMIIAFGYCYTVLYTN